MIAFSPHQLDIINAVFEFSGAAANSLSVHALWRSKEAKGVHWGQWAFYLVWGAWNLVFYPAGGFMLSWLGGIAIMTTNLAWLYLALKFRHSRVTV